MPCGNFLSVTFHFFIISSSPMVLCPADCPAEVHFTTILPAKRQNFRGWGRGEGGGLTRVPVCGSYHTRMILLVRSHC